MTVLENDKYFSIGWDSKFDDKYLDVNNKVFERVKFEINTKQKLTNSWSIVCFKNQLRNIKKCYYNFKIYYKK